MLLTTRSRLACQIGDYIRPSGVGQNDERIIVESLVRYAF